MTKSRTLLWLVDATSLGVSHETKIQKTAIVTNHMPNLILTGYIYML